MPASRPAPRALRRRGEATAAIVEGEVSRPFNPPIEGKLYVEYRNPFTQALGSAAQSAGALDARTRATLAAALTQQTAARQATRARACHSTLENTGIEIGEIIAWRAWRLREDGLLASIHIDKTLWSPGAVVSGVVNNICGVHAFKSQQDAIDCAKSWAIPPPTIVGQVALWGKVIEHEWGYRGSYARVHSIDRLILPAKITMLWLRLQRNRRLRQLRERYGVGAAPETLDQHNPAWSR